MLAKIESYPTTKPLAMKSSRSGIRRKTYAVPGLHFEDQHLRSFSGSVIFQRLAIVRTLAAKGAIEAVFSESERQSDLRSFQYRVVAGGSSAARLSGIASPSLPRGRSFVRRLLGLKRLSDLATNSRILSAMEATGVAHLRHFLTALVVERIQEMDLRRIALDFDGSVTCTGFLAEATAVGFNPKKKGQRRYQPGNQI